MQNTRICEPPLNLYRQLKPPTCYFVGYKTTLLVSQREKIIPLQVKDIASIYLDKTILQITTFNHQRYIISSSLGELERILNPEQFYRANRQFLVNRNVIDSVERFISRKLVLKLKVETQETVVISKAKASDFLRWLEGGNITAEYL